MRSRFLRGMTLWLSWLSWLILGVSAFAQSNSATRETNEVVHWERRPDGVRVCLITPRNTESKQPRERLLLITATT